MFIHISCSESQIVDLLVTTRVAHRLKIPIVVHIYLRRLEPLLSMVYSICTSRWSIIELIDIECVEVLGNVDHFWPIFSILNFN